MDVLGQCLPERAMENLSEPYPTVLTIAGSDSGGCAGIQADIKSISANGAYAASVITATTAQNTVGVTDIHAIPLAHIEKQLDAVLSDIQFDAIKIGMLHSLEVIELVKRKLLEFECKNIVLDPVMVATSGDKLITEEAIIGLKELLPLALIITPNIPEAEILSGNCINEKNARDACREIADKFNTSTLIKGGHLEGTDQMTDWFFDLVTGDTHEIINTRFDTSNTHGTGCSLSSAIAAHLAKGKSLYESVNSACHYLNKAIESGANKKLGKGNGPVNHFFIV